MILKIFKAFWFLSMLVVLANLLYVYAALPEVVVVQDEADGRIMAGKEVFFYALTAVLLIVNATVYLTTRIFADDESFRAWFHGLIITMNIFFVFALNLIQVYNSNETFDFSRVGFMIYGSVMLMVGWALAWPVYAIYRKLFAKQVVV